MKSVRVVRVLGIPIMAATLGGPGVATADDTIEASLRSLEEVPAISSPARGSFRGEISDNGDSIDFKLSYSALQADVLFAHIHFGQRSVNGGVAAFLCGGGGKPACPTPSGTVTGTVTAADVIGPAGQGIASGELDELLDAIDRGVAYVNVHSVLFPGGEIRGQIRD